MVSDVIGGLVLDTIKLRYIENLRISQKMQI